MSTTDDTTREDWRCECGDVNRAHEAGCYRCGAGRPDVERDPASWPVVTAYVLLPIGRNGATPVTLGVGREGRRVGYYSGGVTPADGSEVELWLRLDPDVLADLPEVCEAVARYSQAGGARPGTALEDLPEDLRIREFPSVQLTEGSEAAA